MFIADILAEAGKIPVTLNKKESLKGFTFGFEVEFLVPQQWYVTYYSEGELTPEDIQDLDTLEEWYEFDKYELQHAFRDWKETTGNEEADINDFISDVGAAQIIDDIGGKVAYGKMLIDGVLYEANYAHVQVIQMVGDILENDLEIYAQVSGEEKEADKDYSLWYIEPDASVEGEHDADYAVEITSPIFKNLGRFRSMLKKILAIIDEIGYTNNTCGLHINIGFAPGMKPDFAKLALFMGEKHLGKIFTRAQDNAQIMPHDELLNITTFEKNFDRTIRAMNMMMDSAEEKHFAFNHLPYIDGKNYVEFRVVGGKDYQKNFGVIDQNIARFIFLMKLACDPQMYRRQYMQKAYQMLVGNGAAPPQTSPMVVRRFMALLGQLPFLRRDELPFIDNGRITPDRPRAKARFIEVLYLLLENGRFDAAVCRAMAKQMRFTRDELKAIADRYAEYMDEPGSQTALQTVVKLVQSTIP